MIDQEMTRRFFEMVFGKTWAPELVSIFTIEGQEPNTSVKNFWAAGAEQAAAIAAKEAIGANVYVGCCLRQASAAGKGGRGKVDDVSRLSALWADIDMESPHRKSGKTLPKTEEECDDLLNAIELCPSLIVKTGYGLQPWWILRESFPLDSRESRARAVHLSLAFGRRLGSVAKGLGWDLDAVHSLDHVLRVPGTLHMKGVPRAVGINFTSECRISVAQVEEWLGPDMEAVAEQVGKNGNGAGSERYQSLGPLRVGRALGFPLEKFGAAMANDSRFRLAWQRKRRDLDQSQSGYDMALAQAAAGYQWEAQEIVNLIVAHRIQGGQKPWKVLREDYYRETVGKALAAAQKRRDTQRAKEESEALAVVEAETATEDGPGAVLSLLRRDLGVPIEGVIQSGSDPATYYLDLNGMGRILIGSSEDMLKFNKVQAAIAEKTNTVVRRRKPADWERIAQLFLRIAEKVEIKDLKRAEETGNWISEYLAGFPKLADALAEDKEGLESFRMAFAQTLPFRRNGSVAVHAGELLKHIKTSELAPVTIRELRLRLNEIGFNSEHVTTRIGGDSIGKRYWVGVTGVTGSNHNCNRLENAVESTM